MKGKRGVVLGALFVMMAAVLLWVNAQDGMKKAGEDLEESIKVLFGAEIDVTRQVFFTGRVNATTEFCWKERINGSYYSGTLTLQFSVSDSVQTIATYAGTLYKE